MTELMAPRLHIRLEDGSEWWVDTGNPDLVAWDLTAMKHKWPGVKEAPFLWLTFVAWHASRRKKLLPEGMTFDQFKLLAEQVEGPDDDTAPADDESVGLVRATPTPPGPGPG